MDFRVTCSLSPLNLKVVCVIVVKCNDIACWSAFYMDEGYVSHAGSNVKCIFQGCSFVLFSTGMSVASIGNRNLDGFGRVKLWVLDLDYLILTLISVLLQSVNQIHQMQSNLKGKKSSCLETRVNKEDHVLQSRLHMTSPPVFRPSSLFYLEKPTLCNIFELVQPKERRKERKKERVTIVYCCFNCALLSIIPEVGGGGIGQ